MSQSRRGGPKGNFDLGKYIIVKLAKGKSANFEMIADPTEAYKALKILQEFRKKEKQDQELTIEDVLQNSDISLNDIFPTYDIFKNVKKADRADDEQLTLAFETIEGNRLAAIFLLQGDFAWTQEQRQKWVEKKKKQIITILARNCINPQSKKPHPPKRIEKAMEEAKVSIDLNRSAEEQVETILKKLNLSFQSEWKAFRWRLKYLPHMRRRLTI